MVFSGGIIGSATVSSSEEYAEGYTSFAVGTSLPKALQRHCIASINDSHAIVTGGSSSEFFEEKRVYLFNVNNGDWTGLPTMVRHTCDSMNMLPQFLN